MIRVQPAAPAAIAPAPAGVEGSPAADLSRAWTARPSGPQPRRAVESGRVVLAVADGVRALDPLTGEEAWHHTRCNARLCDTTAVNGLVLAVFSTGPQIRNPLWNTTTEVIGTFVLVYTILQLGNTPTQIGPIAVAFLVLAIGMSLGGPTGYAINPARDLGPRIAHAVLPIRGKGGNDWGYSWVPVVGPTIGGVLAGLVSRVVTAVS